MWWHTRVANGCITTAQWSGSVMYPNILTYTGLGCFISLRAQAYNSPNWKSSCISVIIHVQRKFLNGAQSGWNMTSHVMISSSDFWPQWCSISKKRGIPLSVLLGSCSAVRRLIIDGHLPRRRALLLEIAQGSWLNNYARISARELNFKQVANDVTWSWSTT